MKKIHKILIPVFSVLLVISVVALILSLNGGGLKLGSISSNLSGSVKGADFSTLGSSSVLTKSPPIKSDIDSIYYCLNTDSTVSFYQYNGSSLVSYGGEVKTAELKPECTYQKVPITVYYITVDGKTLGYGLFTTVNSNADVKYYSYIFAKLVDMPSIYGKTGKLLLLSTDEKQAYSQDKTYTEAFSADLSKGTCTSLSSQRDRTADKSGRLAERWDIFTDSYLKTVSKKAGLISGRMFDADTELYGVYDLKVGTNKPAVSSIYGTFVRETSEGGFVYIKKTSDGFKSVEYITSEKTIAEFKGDIKGCVFCGDWVYQPDTKTFTNLLTGKAVEAGKLGFVPYKFCVNEDSSKIAAMADGETQSFAVIDKDGAVTQYTGTEIFTTGIDNMCFLDSSTVLTTTVMSDGASKNLLTKVG